MKAAFVLGRVILGGFFVYNGINHFKERKNLAQYASSKNVPMPEQAVLAAGALLLTGGASLLTGVQPKWGASAILLFLAGATPKMHDFWRVEDPGQRANEMIHFSKNTAIAGAVLSLMSIEEPWPGSITLGSNENQNVCTTY